MVVHLQDKLLAISRLARSYSFEYDRDRPPAEAWALHVGDYVEYGPHPDAVVNALYARVVGNTIVVDMTDQGEKEPAHEVLCLYVGGHLLGRFSFVEGRFHALEYNSSFSGVVAMWSTLGVLDLETKQVVPPSDPQIMQTLQTYAKTRFEADAVWEAWACIA